jgi:hypothetical protein
MASIATGLFALMMGLSGVLYLLAPKPVVDALQALGYPLYFAKMLGVAKVLGALALVVPQARTVREWAYAGFTFDLVAAVVSHLVVGEASHVAQPAVALVLLGISYRLRRRQVGGGIG